MLVSVLLLCSGSAVNQHKGRLSKNHDTMAVLFKKYGSLLCFIELTSFLFFFAFIIVSRGHMDHSAQWRSEDQPVQLFLSFCLGESENAAQVTNCRESTAAL